MAKRQQQRQQPFADIVREVREAPLLPEPQGAGLTDPEGRRWTQHKQQISPAQALALAAAGAAVAWDPCGCGGYCSVTWFSPDEVAHLLRSGTPTVRHTKRRRGNLSEWTTEDGQRLVVAEDAVRWGDLLD